MKNRRYVMQNLYHLIYEKAYKPSVVLNLSKYNKYYNPLKRRIRKSSGKKLTNAVLLFCFFFYFLFMALFVQFTYCDPVMIEMERINNSIQGIFQKGSRARRTDDLDYKCATPIIHYALKHRELLWPENRFILYRPDNPSFVRYYSPDGLLYSTYDTDTLEGEGEGHFKIHYKESGNDAVFESDGNSSTTPDYVIRFGIYFEKTWNNEINILGYNPPPPDGNNGGDEKFDVYIKDINYYGYTAIENGHPYIVVDNDYTDKFYRENFDPNGNEAGRMKVTAAHEFFHAVQYFYDDWNNGCLWWEENTAVWMEDEVFDYVDDYLHYIPNRLLNMEIPLDDESRISSKYGGVIWARFLSERYETDIIRYIFERFLIDASLAKKAIEYTLYNYNSSWGDAMSRFCLKNLKMDYEDGDRFLYYLNPNITFTEIIHSQISTADIEEGYLELGLNIRHLSCKYFKFVADTQTESIRINLTSRGTVFPLTLFVADENPTGNPIWDIDVWPSTGMDFVLDEFGTSSTYPRAYLIVINPDQDNDNCQYFLTTDINNPALQIPVVYYPVAGQVIISQKNYPPYLVTLSIKNLPNDPLDPNQELEYIFELYKNHNSSPVDSQIIPEDNDNSNGTSSCQITLNDKTGGLYFWRCQARVANSNDKSYWTPLSDFYLKVIFKNEAGCFISALP